MRETVMREVEEQTLALTKLEDDLEEAKKLATQAEGSFDNLLFIGK